MCTRTSVRRRPGGQLTETPEDQLGQAISCLVFAALRHRGQRAFIDEGVTGDLPGRRRAVEIQQRLPVQRDGMTLVDLLAAGRAARGRTANRTDLTQTKHQEPRASRRHCGQQTPSATEVRSDYLTLPRVETTTTRVPDQMPARRTHSPERSA